MIDVLKKIDELRLQHNWSIYKLSEEACLTQSTISNMFNRKTLPTISTLLSICDAFNITLSEFFDESSNSSSKDLYVLSSYKQLCERDKNIVKNLIEDMIKNKNA